VVIGDILVAEGHAVEADIKAKGGEAAFVRLDVTSEADWQAAVGLAASRFGALNVLVNNAGIGGWGRIEDTTVEDWTRTMDINAKACSSARRPPSGHAPGRRRVDHQHLVPARPGRDRQQQPAVPGLQGAVRLLTKATAIQYAREGIRANSFTPDRS